MLLNRNGQTATEYLVLVAVVIIIAVLVINILGGIPGIGTGSVSRVSSAALLLEDVGVVSAKLNIDSGELTVRNNRKNNIELINMTLNGVGCQVCGGGLIRPGKTSTVRCGDVFSQDVEGDDFSYEISASFVDKETDAIYIIDYDDVELVGEVSALEFVDTDGSIEWNTTYGESSAEYLFGAAVDNCNDLLITGHYNYRVNADTATTIKYSPSGQIKFVRDFGTDSEYDFSDSVAVDGVGNVYVGGGTNSFGAGDRDILLIKYDKSGNRLWNVTWGGFSNDRGSDVAFDFFNNVVYLSGHTNSSGAGGFDTVLLKYDTEGTLLWNTTWGGSSDEFATDSFVSNDGSIYVSGLTNSFGAGNNDAILLKYDSDGTLLWNVTYGGTQEDAAQDVVTTRDGMIYVAGYTESFGAGNDDVFLLKYNPGGTLIWNTTWGDTGRDQGYNIAIDPLEYVYVSGETTSYGEGSTDIMLLKYDSDGTLIWNTTWGGTGADFARGLITDTIGSVYAVGGTLSFGNGDWDYAIVKFT